MGGAVAFAVGLLSTYTLMRLKGGEGGLAVWEKRALVPLGWAMTALCLGFSALLLGYVGFGFLYV